ncbi:MAG: NfeD family protein [Neomegalonema sp.]|nr:NfeD family protein [Neomegalonema sp.]
MTDLISFIATASPWWWVAVGLALMLLETATMSFFLLWPGIAAVLVGVALWLFPSLTGAEQLVLFAILATLITIAGRWFFASPLITQASDRPDLNERHRQLIGLQVTALGDFEHGLGSVSVQDGQWPARIQGAGAVSRGTALIVTEVQGATLVVKPLDA